MINFYKKEVSRKSDREKVSDWKQSAAGLIMKINFPKHWHLSRCCGRKFSEKRDAYVSDVRIVIQVNRLKTLTC